MPSRVCLIVDNPLRDLEGLILLGWHLANAGIEVYLVPMYTQAFDVYALNPDFVLANYARPNNVDLLRRYRASGICVGVLDTEGAAGKNANEYAQMVARVRCEEFVDLYCVWGIEQFEALRRCRAVPESVLRLTGCPRYDFCAAPWRAALPKPKVAGGYILVNTNFPVVNPRFSRGAADEQRAMVRAGFDKDFAHRFTTDARMAHQIVVQTMARMAERFKSEHFVVRPHPFENCSAYTALTRFSNVEIRQEGTSLEWINAAKLLIHQNCSTAIEAVMLGCEPVSLEWFNTAALLVPAPSRVSLHVHSETELEQAVSSIIAGTPPELPSEQIRARKDIIRAYYLANDGLASRRVAQAIVEAMEKRSKSALAPSSTSVRSTMIHTARALLGYRLFEASLRGFSRSRIQDRRRAKRFGTEQVDDVLFRISGACGAGNLTHARYLERADYHQPRLASGQSVRIYTRNHVGESRCS